MQKKTNISMMLSLYMAVITIVIYIPLNTQNFKASVWHFLFPSKIGLFGNYKWLAYFHIIWLEYGPTM